MTQLETGSDPRLERQVSPVLAALPPVQGTSMLRSPGPGLIVGAAEGDPNWDSYPQPGRARCGRRLVYNVVHLPALGRVFRPSVPLSRIASVGIAHNLRCFYPAWLS